MIKVGILGTGFGKTHLEIYQRIDGVQVVSVFGRNKEKLDSINKEHDVQTTDDIAEVLDNPDIDLIDVCLPTKMHAEWVIKALKSGKHVFCETPISYSYDEACDIQKASLQFNKNVYVNLFIKFSAPHKYAIELLKNGDCGKLIGIRTYNKTSSRWGDLGLKNNLESFHNHMMDYTIELAGMPNSVTASGFDYGSKSIITSFLKYNSLYAILESNSAMPECCPFEIGFELLCTEGIIRFDAVYGDYTSEEFSITVNGKIREIMQIDEVDDFEESIRHVLYCLQNNKKSDLIDIEAAANTIKLKEMVVNAFA